MNLEFIKNKAVPILKRHGIKKASVFGSFARGEEKHNSDIYILIEYLPETKKSLFKRIELKYDLQDVLNADVDLVTENALSPYIKDKVLKKRGTFCEQR
ncbi:MAG: hypothetical protein APF76_13610 [Desulfitibacter sp. BRH_c19]|nr:MAG: hypothetical protein APF76_13610 [Desulfitibacter sp. BRH_c19]